MDIDEKEEKTESRGSNLKKIASDILELAGETIGTLASPSTLWLMVLWNCSGGKGFNGFVTNKSSLILPPGGGKLRLIVRSITEGGQVTATIDNDVKPEGTYFIDSGTTVTIIAHPFSGEELGQWKINGIDRGKKSSFDIVISQDTLIEAEWFSTAI